MHLQFLYSFHLPYACVNCNRDVRNGIVDSLHDPLGPLLFSSFAVLLLMWIVLCVMARRRYAWRISAYRNPGHPMPVLTASMALGLGLGGLFDGIIFHELLQWHQMVSSRIIPDTLTSKSVNMFWDGVFHLFCWLAILGGVILLWKVLTNEGANKSPFVVASGLLAGWGVFNLVEGLLNHYILDLHDVNENSPRPGMWNASFLIFGTLLLVISRLLFRRRLFNQRHAMR